jgi:beta-lactamase superfamily II metal-dependent hydrolase
MTGRLEQRGGSVVSEISDGPLALELLPARHGDAILLTWGSWAERHHLLIDGGPAAAYPKVSERLAKVAPDSLDLLVLTHIDADHIEGSLLLANDAGLNIGIREFWFNGPAQIAPKLGTAQGEMLAALVGARGIPLNTAFGKAAICAPDAGARPVHRLPGGLTITVLGPDRESLAKLSTVWLSSLQDGGLVFASEEQALQALRGRAELNPAKTFLSGGKGPPSVPDLLQQPSSNDTSTPNRSSIVLLAEYAGNTVLLPGDATPPALLTAVRRLLAERGLARLELTAFKLPHHGSKGNITKELLAALPADNYLFSSDGGKFGHPDDAGVAKCLAYGKPGSALLFNYRNPRTLRWQDPDALGPHRNRALYPVTRSEGISLSMPAHEQQE